MDEPTFILFEPSGGLIVDVLASKKLAEEAKEKNDLTGLAILGPYERRHDLDHYKEDE